MSDKINVSSRVDFKPRPLPQNETLEISQVANGYIVRLSPAGWFRDLDTNAWFGSRKEYYVFSTFAGLATFLAGHFTHRATPDAILPRELHAKKSGGA